MSRRPTDTEGEQVHEKWYASAFDTLYPLVYAHRSVESAAREAAFAVEQMGLYRCEAVLDLCCGGGRHLYHLSQHCYELVGLDYSSDLLRIAQQDLPPHVHLVRGDMRALPFGARFDAVANFFTSFGYFQEDRENWAVLETVASVLKPGGKFFMDYLNPAYVRRTLEPRSEREQDGLRIVEQRWISEDAPRVNKSTEIYEGGSLRSTASESVRLYEPAEMQDFFERAGFRIERTFGDYSGVPVGPEHPRTIYVATRN